MTVAAYVDQQHFPVMTSYKVYSRSAWQSSRLLRSFRTLDLFQQWHNIIQAKSIFEERGFEEPSILTFKLFLFVCFCVFYYITGFLKTVLVKKINSFYYLAINLKQQKIIQRPIKSLSLTPGSKLEVPRSISTSPNLK